MQYAGAYSAVWYPFPLEHAEPQVMDKLAVRDKEGREHQQLQQGHHKLFFKPHLCYIPLAGVLV